VGFVGKDVAMILCDKVTGAVQHAARFRGRMAAVGLLVAGCGGQADRNPAPDDDTTGSGIEGSKTLDELEMDEVNSLCEAAIGNYAEQVTADFERGFCILDVGAGAASVAECEQVVDSQCFFGADSFGDDDVAECVEDIGSVDECKPTVEQLERCIDAQLEYLNRIANLTCESVLELEDPQSLDSIPAPCQELSRSCPALFEPSEGGGTTEPPPQAPGGPSVSGNIDGQAVQSEVGSLSVSLPGSSQKYSVGVADGAELRLTGDGELGQGLLRLPQGGGHRLGLHLPG
jgi:hypothetical protein